MLEDSFNESSEDEEEEEAESEALNKEVENE
jgi:hypothetical protein